MFGIVVNDNLENSDTNAIILKPWLCANGDHRTTEGVSHKSHNALVPAEPQICGSVATVDLALS